MDLSLITKVLIRDLIYTVMIMGGFVLLFFLSDFTFAAANGRNGAISSGRSLRYPFPRSCGKA